MAEYLIQDITLTGIADAIRNKIDSTNVIKVSDMTSLISTISSVRDVATAEEMDALLISNNIGKFYRYTGISTNVYEHGDIYIVEG